MALTDKLTAIGNAIRTKTGGSALIPLSDMPAEILSIETGEIPVQNPALILWDWEGTKLAEYSREDALALTELPASDILPPYAAADHELLVFQSWTRSLANIKTWIQNHEGETLNIGAIYTTTDGVDHNYWENPRLTDSLAINMQKRGTASIGDRVFQFANSLKQINIPDGTTIIGNYAFQYCYSLKQINIPDGVTGVGASAFQNCYSLKQINIPDGVTWIGNYAFQYCYSLTQINIPDRVTSIGNSAFADCRTLTQINIPDRVTSIGNSAFADCRTLSQINIPDRVTSIDDRAFQNCQVLKQINIPDGVTSIGSSAFADCRALCDILNESKSTLSNINAFGNLPSIYRVYVPRANLSWYETATNWSTIYSQGHIVAIEDYIDYLESIGFNVDKYKEAT